MSSYAQWRAAADKGERPRRVTFVCGDQPTLIQEVIATTQATLAPDELNCYTFSARNDSAQTIWAAAHQHALTDDTPRLIVVRDAQHVTAWQPLAGFVAAYRELASTHLLFVSTDPGYPSTPQISTEPHFILIRARGRFVRCTMPNETDLLAWVRRRGSTLPDKLITHLVDRTGADLTTIATTCAKLAVLPGTPTEGVIDLLCQPSPTQSFVEHLLEGDKPQALLTIPDLDSTEALGVVALLDNRLDLLVRLWQANRAGLRGREITSVPQFLVRRWVVHSKGYDPRRCVYARRVLVVIDGALRSGARDGVLEALVALW